MGDLPYLFLDVDGVLNAFDGRNVGDWDDFCKKEVHAPEGGVAGTVVHKFRMRISKKMCAVLAALPAEIHWATTWEHWANERLYHLTGFNDYPVACRMPPGALHQGLTEEQRWWKFEAIFEMVKAAPRPFIWCDDEAIPEWASERFRELGQPFMLVEPNEDIGLTQQMIVEMRMFLARNPLPTPGPTSRP